MPGSDNEPVVPPEEAAVQMQEATERLRDKAWMVAPMTSAVPLTPEQQAEVDGQA
ncbi:MAG TPA: hypothetical protein VFJ98_08365 [Mycobacteriales bacterium]|nr:hypothetical protein [Mycobacteriales bacterium]